MAEIVLYTESFPFHNTETFLETEIMYLSSVFDKIHIVPLKDNGIQRSVPSNVSVHSPIKNNSSSLFIILMYGLFHCHLLFSDKNLRSNLKKTPFIKSLKYLGYALIIKKEINKNLIRNAIIHYSYWLNYQAFALSLLKHQGKIKIFISRAHGFDLYSEREETSLQFLQSSIISRIDKLFTVSEHGLNYLKEKYPEFADKFHLSFLGTASPGFLNPLNEENIIKIVTCFIIRPVKRIQLILDGLKRFSDLYPSISVQWDHFGGGIQFNHLKLEARNIFRDTNIKWNLHGNKTNQKIFDYYKSEAIDVFLNTSQSEGLPVSVMEAQSSGIPVIATDVGGTHEIVNNENGLLLRADPDPDEIASALYDVYTEKDKWRNKRNLSLENWEKNFSAEINYNLFASVLLSLTEENKTF